MTNDFDEWDAQTKAQLEVTYVAAGAGPRGAGSRSPSTPAGVREAILAMVADPGEITEKTYRQETRHDPSAAMAGFVELRDVFCDGPTGTRVPAARCHHDHDRRYPLEAELLRPPGPDDLPPRDEPPPF